MIVYRVLHIPTGAYSTLLFAKPDLANEYIVGSTSIDTLDNGTFLINHNRNADVELMPAEEFEVIEINDPTLD